MHNEMVTANEYVVGTTKLYLNGDFSGVLRVSFSSIAICCT